MGRSAHRCQIKCEDAWGPKVGGRIRVLVGIATTASLHELSSVDPPATDLFLSVEEGAEGIDIDVNGKGKEGPKKKLGYDAIPGFVFRHMGQEQTVANVLDCEELCDKEDTCRSYSFNPKESLCVWSIETIRYRLGWEFWTKVHELDAFGKWRHYGKYRSFPDIMYQEPGYTQLKQVSVKNCQKTCNKDDKCKAFSYQAKRQRCYLADSGIHYDPAFTYYERRGMKPRKNVMDMEDQQQALQVDEQAAKKAKRRRLVVSIQERQDKNAKTADEMRQKGNRRESDLKYAEKKHSENRLAREKTLEAHDKRLARMKTVYNEGYFKAKGVAAEKATKEKDIKRLRAKEVDDKDKRKEQMKKQKNRKKTEENRAKKERSEAQERLLTAKEKETKLKNEDMSMEVEKEERILDVAKNLALEKAGQTTEAKENEKEVKYSQNMKNKKKIWELRHKAKVARMYHKEETKMLKHMKIMTENKQYDSHKYDLPPKLPNVTSSKTPTPKA